jgi:fructose PTS system EIIA component
MDILNEEIMAVNVPGTTKEEAINTLANLLKKKNYISDVPSFEKDIYHREALGQTGIGNFIAIPHGLSESALKNGVAIGKFSNEIPWETLDGKGVRIVCLFCVQAGDGREKEHLKMLAKLAGKLGNDEVVNNILKADTVHELKQAFA